MSLKVYTDTISQPCRAVQLLLEANKVPYEQVTLQLRAGMGAPVFWYWGEVVSEEHFHHQRSSYLLGEPPSSTEGSACC